MCFSACVHICKNQSFCVFCACVYFFAKIGHFVCRCACVYLCKNESYFVCVPAHECALGMSVRPKISQTAAKCNAETLNGCLALFRPVNRIQMDLNTVIDQKDPVILTISTCIRTLSAKPSSSSFALCPIPDLTVMEVPANFYTGANNVSNLLTCMDVEYNVVCGFIQFGVPHVDNSYVVIAGQLRQRRAAELKIMATIENKQRGFYSFRTVRNSLRVIDRDWLVGTEQFDTDTVVIAEDELSFALGHKGSIRKKLAVASGCIMEYVGEVAYLSGTLSERTRGREYLRWVLQQLSGEVVVGDYSGRTDISCLPLTKRAAGFVNGNKGKVLRTVEEMTGTFCFIGKPTSRDVKPLFVCGHAPGRDAAVYIFDKYVKDHQASDWMNDAVDASLATEMTKPSLEQLLKAKNLSNYRPVDPWRVPNDSHTKYMYMCQPCPGAARPDTQVITEASNSSKRVHVSSEKQASQQPLVEFVNDDSAFPELGGGKVRPTNSGVSAPSTVPLVPSVAPPAPEPVQSNSIVATHLTSSPMAPPPPPPESPDAGIYIDEEMEEVWGDWGLGPHGDPELGNDIKSSQWPATPTKSVKPVLLGAWK